MPQDAYRMQAPTGCVLWRDPEPTARAPIKRGFARVESFVEDSHLFRYLLKCRECGQLYFFQFEEEVDWADGDDPQYCTWVPVATVDEGRGLGAVHPLNLRLYTPHLCKDWPKGEAQRIYWVTGEGPE